MPRTISRRPLPALTAACLAALAFLPGAAFGKLPPPAKDFWKEGEFLGVESCRTCHLQSAGRKTDFVLLTEYTTWRGLDKHAQAYAALMTDRGKQIGKILGVDVLKDEAGCLGCHSMGFTRGRTGQDFNIKDGVSCDGCHGPAEGWYALHSGPFANEWRTLTGEQKEAYGMRDVRNPVKKAEMCASCHVGSVEEGKVITHAMYAAGHPPLPPFEVETFCKNLPQHWRDRKDVPYFQNPPKNVADKVREIYHMATAPVAQTQLSLVGSAAVLRAQMQVIAERANMNAKTDRAQRWPELALASFELPKDIDPTQLWPDLAMSHSDCYACHHELVTPSWRQQRGYDLIFPGGKVVGIPGRVQVRRWPFALAGWGPADSWAAPGADGKGNAGGLAEKVRALYEVCNIQPYGDPAKVRVAALNLGEWLNNGPIKNLASDRLKTDDLPALVQKLCTSPASEYADYESARQIASAIRTVVREWDPSGDKASGVNAVLDKMEEELDVHPYVGRGKRLALIRAKLAKAGGGNLPSNKELLHDLEASSSQEFSKVLTGNDLDAFQKFLMALQNLPAQDISDVLFAQDSLKDINDIGNEELERYLNAANRFEPEKFRAHLAELAKLLSGK